MNLLRPLLPLSSFVVLAAAVAACSGQVSSPDGGSDASADASPDSGACPPGESFQYSSAGCGTAAVGRCAPPPPPCAEEFCGCDGKTIIGCGSTGSPFASKGACTDGGLDGGADSGKCPPGESFQYATMGCGTAAVGRCGPPPPPCAEPFCGCDGKTITGCGVTSSPFAYKGECADGGAAADTCTPAGGTCGPISDCDRGEGQLGGNLYSCGPGAPGTNVCCFKPPTKCGSETDFDCCSSGSVARPICVNDTLVCASGTKAPVGTCR